MSTFVKKVTSAVAGLAVVFSMVSPIAGVSAAYSALDAANELATIGVIVDQSANPSAYRLGDTTSREELSKIIANLGGLTVTPGESVYADVDFAPWAEKYAKALNEAGYAASNEFFNPKNNATKIEALKWVMEARGIATGTGDNWMEARVNGAVEAGIATAFTDYNADASRGQVFIWAAEAVKATDDSATDDDLLCSILGNCDKDEDKDETPSEPTTPVVDGDNKVEVSLSPLSPTAGVVAAGKDRTPFLAIDVTAGSSDVTLDEITLGYVGLSSASDFENLKVYLGNDQITKQDSKRFDSDKEAELTFENDTVIQAGKTQTLVIAGKVTDSSTNVSHQIKVLNIEASSDVEMGTVKSVVFGTVSATNTASLDVDVDAESGKLEIGKVEKFADFTLEEKGDNEDVVVKSLTFEFGGGVDAEDDIADIVLLADGKQIASNLSVNNDDEVIVNLEYTIDADDSVDFELEGVVTGSIGKTLTVKLTEVYAVGATTGVIASVDDDENAATNYTESNLASFSSVDGAEINVSFDKSDIDESKPDAEGVLVGTLKMEAASDYTVDEIQVTVKSTKAGTTTGVHSIVKQLELDGDTEDSVSTSSTGATTVVFSYKDISLKQGVEKTLDLTADLEDAVALNGETVEFTIKVVQVEDEENDETFNNGTIPNLNSVLSSNSFDTHSIDIESANFTLTQTKLSQRNLVLGNGIEVVLYKGKLSVGDADSVTFKDFKFNGTITDSGSTAVTAYDFEDIIDQATLNIGGVTETESADSSSIEFNGMDIEVAAGADEVDVLLTAKLKDNDTVSAGDLIEFSLVKTDIVAKDSDNEDLLASAKEVNVATNNAVVELNDRGTFTINIVNNGDNEDEINDVVLAGTSGVALAELTFEAEEEDVKVDELRLTLSGAKDTTVKNVRIMNGSTTIDTASSVTVNGSGNTIVEFKDFTVTDNGSEVDALIVADLEIITSEGGVASAEAGNITVQIAAASDVEAKGASSNDDLTVGNGLTVTTATVSDAVNVVPVIITVADGDDLGNNDKYATADISIDFGNNDLDNTDLYLQTVKLEKLSGSGVELRNDDSDSIVLVTPLGSGNDVDVAVDLTNATNRALAKVNNNDEIEFKVAADDEELRVKKNGFVFFLDLNNNGSVDAGETVESSNDNVVDFGEYNEVN